MHCDSLGKCPQSQMFCFSKSNFVSDNSVCCENFFYRENEQKNIEGELPNNNNILGMTTETFLEDNNLLISTTKTKHSPKTLKTTTSETTTIKTTTPTFSTLFSSTSLIKLENEKFPTLIGTKDGEVFKYETFTKEEQEKNDNEGNNNEDNNDSAKNFLLEQIKQGWPYNDKFYREPEPSDSEDIIVLRKRGRPEAIV
ncbi:hypothetical protein Mgra_00007712, partial [Meloidogyne graminicola]